MIEGLPVSEETLSGIAIYGSIIAVALWEFLRPRRPLRHLFRLRWTTNFGLGLFNMTAMGLLLPLGAVTASLWASEVGVGLFNSIELPAWVVVIATILALDLVKYAQHRLFHCVPWLWRLHRIHHADLDVDFTTNFRHHPLETLLSVVILLVTVALLGAPAIAIVIHKFIEQPIAFWDHGNLSLPLSVEPFVRAVLVTPDLHFIHHSAFRRETDSNLATIFSFWDRLFGTYRAAPAAGYDDMTIGIEHFRETRDLRLDRALLMPFLNSAASSLGADIARSEENRSGRKGAVGA